MDPSGNVVVTATGSDGVSSVTAGNGIQIGGSGTDPTIAVNLTEGTGIAITQGVGDDLVISSTFVAGDGIEFVSDGDNLAITATGVGINSISAGAGISVSEMDPSGNVTVTNGGILDIVPGNGIGITGTNGEVTVTNTGVRSITAGDGIDVSAMDPSGNVVVSATTGIVTTFSSGGETNTISCPYTTAILHYVMCGGGGGGCGGFAIAGELESQEEGSAAGGGGGSSGETLSGSQLLKSGASVSIFVGGGGPGSAGRNSGSVVNGANGQNTTLSLGNYTLVAHAGIGGGGGGGVNNNNQGGGGAVYVDFGGGGGSCTTGLTAGEGGGGILAPGTDAVKNESGIVGRGGTGGGNPLAGRENDIVGTLSGAAGGNGGGVYGGEGSVNSTQNGGDGQLGCGGGGGSGNPKFNSGSSSRGGAGGAGYFSYWWQVITP
jgi:hypothetical protein